MINKLFTKETAKRLTFILTGGLLYCMIFNFVEQREVPVNILHTNFDDMIPFCEYFIVPYFMWFLFVAATVAYFAVFSKNSKKYHELIGGLVFGMAIFLVISLFFPNGQDLRPDIRVPQNIFQKACLMLYSTDTSTNVLPSLHVYNAVVCCYAILSDKVTSKSKFLSVFTFVLTAAIVLSTMFLKQHTVIDVVAAFLLNYFAYLLFVRFEFAEKILDANSKSFYLENKRTRRHRKVRR